MNWRDENTGLASTERAVVIKIGGELLNDTASLNCLGAALAQLSRKRGGGVVVCHGGGAQITKMMARLGKRVEFVEGLRVSDAETIDISAMVLLGETNRKLVSALIAQGLLAVGLTGIDAALISVGPRDKKLGYVGEVTKVQPELLNNLLAGGYLPVIAPFAAGPDGETYNINADEVAGAVAAALKAESLIVLTNVAGIYNDLSDQASLISTTDASALQAMIADGRISDGMIPKVRGILRALEGGVAEAHVVDGRNADAALNCILVGGETGTLITERVIAPA